MKENSYQKYYTEYLSHRYGYGTNNEFGYQLKTYWNGNQTVSHFTPKHDHTALTGNVYGELITLLIHCHSTGSGEVAMEKAFDESDRKKYIQDA